MAKKIHPRDTENTEKAEKTVYDFSGGRRCPACNSSDTEARSTQGGVQYRHCRRIGCEHHHRNYAVVGKEI